MRVYVNEYQMSCKMQVNELLENIKYLCVVAGFYLKHKVSLKSVNAHLNGLQKKILASSS